MQNSYTKAQNVTVIYDPNVINAIWVVGIAPFRNIKMKKQGP